MSPRRTLTLFLVLSALAVAAPGCASTSEPSGDGSGDGGYVGPKGCSVAPDCAACSACFDTCLCNTGNAAACLAQCTGSGGASSGGTGGGSGGAPIGGGGGVPAGGGAPGGRGGGGGSCTQLTTGKPSCDACAHSTCCAQIDGCLMNNACLGFLTCLNQYCATAGPNLSACAQQYCAQYAAGVGAYNAIAQCIGQSCASAC